MESRGLENHDKNPRIIRALEQSFYEEGLEITVEVLGDELIVECSGIQTFQIALNGGELVIDYIENDGTSPGAGRKAVDALKKFGEEYGYDVRASGVLPDAIEFWDDAGFVKDGKDYIYKNQD